MITPEDQETVRQLVAAGLTDEDAANAAGLSLRTYQRRKAELFIQRAREEDGLPPMSPTRIPRIERHHAETMAVLTRIAVALEKIAGDQS